ncbi:MAG: DUF3426 domain-containing protein [Betaproteobacteria bacterium]|jgi:predicted Zn finger-like uncharacterized protein|nr:DUF3426 domain-containing protein [Betaproteobacteria bacterium]
MNASSLTTRCAHCHTVFRVTAKQLRSRAGRVRCGRCLRVFDALAGLEPDPSAAVVVPATTATPSLPPHPAAVQESAPEAVISAQARVEGGADAAIAATPATTPTDCVEAVALPAAENQMPEATAQSGSLPGETVHEEAHLTGVDAAPATPYAATDDNPFIAAAPARAPEPRRRVYALASVLLVLLLAGQAVYAYRGELAARHVLAREWVSAACEMAGCAVEMPQRPRQVMIEGSDLQVIDPARPERIQLTATLRNHAAHAVGFPALDLVLTNANDHTLARRIFLPADYLPANIDRSAGLATQAEMTVRLALDAGGVGASGFRLAVLAAAP